jgi:hypothetical protein
MPIEYAIDPRLGTTLVVWHGAVSPEEFLAHVHRLLEDTDWPPAQGLHLCDLRAADVEDGIDRAVLEQAAALYGSHPRIAGLRVAIVAGEAFERAVLFEKFLSQYRAAAIAFNTLETACTWLGVLTSDAEHALQALTGHAHSQPDD